MILWSNLAVFLPKLWNFVAGLPYSNSQVLGPSDAFCLFACDAFHIWAMPSLVESCLCAAEATIWDLRFDHHARIFLVSASFYWEVGGKICVGEGTDFALFLKAVSSGSVYFDPGGKIEGASSARPTTHRRSQFRVSNRSLGLLYEAFSVESCSLEGWKFTL